MPPVAANARANRLPVDLLTTSPTSFNFQLVGATQAAGISTVVSSEAAAVHSERSDRLSTIQNTELGKAIAGKYTYSASYNKELLDKSELARVHLHFWEKKARLDIDSDIYSSQSVTQSIDENHSKVRLLASSAQTVLDLWSLTNAASSATKLLVSGATVRYMLAPVAGLGWRLCTISLPEIPSATDLKNANCLPVKSRLFINSLYKKFWFFALPVFQSLNG